MFLNWVSGTLVGLILGSITGLIPGIHINAITALIASKDFSKYGLDPILLASTIVSLSIAHTLFDYIPTTYLGAPQEENVLSVLPAHQLLKEGRGHEAVKILVLGATVGLAITIACIPIILKYSQFLEQEIKTYIPFLLIAVISYMVLREDKLIQGSITLILSGLLGYVSLNLPIREPLFPLLTGLFGLSGLAFSTSEERTKMPPQNVESKIEMPSKEIIKNSIGGLILGLPCSMLPAMGSGYATTINAEISSPSRRGFLFSSGMFAAISIASSLFLVYIIDKARTGAAAGLKEIVVSPNLSETIALTLSGLISATVSAFIVFKLSKEASKFIERVNYGKISGVIFLMLTAAILILSGLQGLIVAFTGCAIGINAIKHGVKRIHMMGCLIIPTIIIYLT